MALIQSAFEDSLALTSVDLDRFFVKLKKVDGLNRQPPVNSFTIAEISRLSSFELALYKIKL